MLQNIRFKVSNINGTLHPYGFFDKVGTWYSEGDLYGVDVKAIEQCKLLCVEPTIALYLRAAMWRSPEAKNKLDTEMKREEDWKLWFQNDSPISS